jgi:putative protease
MQEGKMPEKQVGKVVHYFHRIGVAALSITDDGLRVGDVVHIKGHTTDLTEKIETMQIEHQAVTEALPGQDVAIKVAQPVRTGDTIYVVTP